MHGEFVEDGGKCVVNLGVSGNSVSVLESMILIGSLSWGGRRCYDTLPF